MDKRKFNAWATLQNEWRDLAKDSKTPDHWVEKKVEKNRPKEIAAFQLALPDDVLMQLDNCMDRMSVDEAKSPWVYQEKLKELFTGQDNIMP